MAQEIDQDFQMGETLGPTTTWSTLQSSDNIIVNSPPPHIPKIGILIQARTTSTRFPNKVLAHFNGKPIIQRIIEELRVLELPIVVSMPLAHTNDALYDFIVMRQLAGVHRSKWENNVLCRFIEAAKIYEFDIIIRICADCPLIKSFDVTQMLSKFMKEGGKRMIWGMGCWIFTKEMLEEVENNSIHADDREHCGFHYMSKSVDFDDDLERLQNVKE